MLKSVDNERSFCAVNDSHQYGMLAPSIMKMKEQVREDRNSIWDCGGERLDRVMVCENFRSL